MKTIGVWVLGLALAAPAFAQDAAGDSADYQQDNSYSDAQEGNSFSDESVTAEEAPASDAMDETTDAAASSDAATDASEAVADDASAPSDAADANSFSSDGSDANSFSNDSASTDGSDANSFSSDSGSADGSDANSFSSDTGDGNSFSSDDSGSGTDGGYDATESASDEGSYGSDDSGTGEEEAAEPIPLYLGADYAWTTASFSNDTLKAKFGSDQLDSNMIRVRGGVRMFKKIGLEVQYGFDGQGADETSNEYSTANFYGVYLVPTGVLLDFLEVGASIGYASTKLERGNESETLSGASFGVNFELPVLTTESFDIRIGGGGTVYRAQPSARIYGYHAGVRIDFRI
ncbi:hypothetical protein E4T66_04140 [Sinimarinibacterium sp. CAU 1509]|uniref:hypothetical protein n=1 Tax=Sinimarinibacterium sp. CAU 1509 TaxID=2562283 RepID=UPI0010ABE774|nr:hypothetical protein [Sinimarinibacterium sp. CAU 1509]TJY62915.1 hypothetical protein E4T66_04140 [Sinimarinibacterium sp. CAU 1509]